MARTYSDGASPAYDAATAKSTDPAYTTFTPFDFGGNFTKKADNSIAGMMRDCAECHVGGGFNQYYTSSVTTPVDASAKKFQYDPANRTDYRNANFGTSVNSFNTFIDIFGLDGLGFEAENRQGVARDLDPASPTYVGPTYAAKTNDYAQTGALEMDCLMCHLDGYSWEKRRDEVRKGNFDSSRVAGAGLGTVVQNVYSAARNVVYNNNVVVVDGNLTLSANVGAKIAATPKSTNCASCHQAEYQVDWKKRGEIWKAGNEVHYGFGCMACHERKTGAAVGTTGLVTEVALGQCDPAKGIASPFDAMWNPLDKVAFKSCEDCHAAATTPTWDTYGAPRADAAHQAAGLTVKLLQAAGVKNGVASKSHIDIIDCTACHTKNKTGITGGAFVDGTGTDEQGRVALHDSDAVSKNMSDGMAMHWLGGKLYSANLLTSFFWRDMNDFGYDANQDGRAGGMDALLPSHVAKINLDNGKLHALAADGVIDTAEIAARQALITSNIAALNGATIPMKSDTVTPNFAPRISMLTVPFKSTHNISPADDAWGKPTRDESGAITAYGCDQCHGANKGFYNGAYPINGTGLTWTFGPNQLATFTKVNGKSDASEGHPNILDKHGKRTVAFTLFNPAPAGADLGTLTNIDRSAVIYEATFKDQAPALTTFSALPIVGSTATGIMNSSSDGGVSTKGHILKIDVQTTDATPVAKPSRTWAVNAECTSIAQVITAMGVFATDANTFGFTITDGGANNIVITPSAGYMVKLNAATDFGPFGLGGKAYVNAPQAGVLGGSYGGASTWVPYLNSITATKSGIGVKPFANFSSSITDISPLVAGTQVAKDVAVPLAAYTAQAGDVGFSTYTWTASDGTVIAGGKTSAATFTTTGLKTITLKVTDEEGYVSIASQQVDVIVPVADDVSWVDTPGNLGGTLTLAAQPLSDKLKIMWGDGTYTYVTAVDMVATTKTRTYAAAGNKAVKVYVYKNGVQKGYFTKTITVDGTN
ncbi:MAG: PKD domain-containing protein [Geobacteraceae bacterium]|nr:PKD domain-containing protein [Geobacteraceae bacterium]